MHTGSFGGCVVDFFCLESGGGFRKLGLGRVGIVRVKRGDGGCLMCDQCHDGNLYFHVNRYGNDNS